MKKLLIVSAVVITLGLLVAIDFLATTSVLAQMAANTTKAGNMTSNGGNMTANATGQVSGRPRR